MRLTAEALNFDPNNAYIKPFANSSGLTLPFSSAPFAVPPSKPLAMCGLALIVLVFLSFCDIILSSADERAFAPVAPAGIVSVCKGMWASLPSAFISSVLILRLFA